MDADHATLDDASRVPERQRSLWKVARDATRSLNQWLLLRIGGAPFPSTMSGRARVVFLMGLAALGGGITAFRLPRSSWNVVWAEDGAVFLKGALTSPPGVIFEPYSGYLHVPARVLAEVAALFPLSVAPITMTLLTAASVGLLACACFVFLETLIRRIPHRLAAWFAILAAPVAGGEVLGSLANLHWYFLVAAFCAVAARTEGRSWGFTAAQAGVVALAVSSDALGLLLVPLVVIRLWLWPTARERVFLGSVLAATAVQVVGTVAGTVLGGNRQISQSAPMLGEFVDFYAFRVLLPGTVGVTWTERLAVTVGPILPGVTIALVGLLIVVAIRRGGTRAFPIALFATCSVLFAVIVDTLQWQWLVASPLTMLNSGDRYSVVPSALMVVAIILALDSVVDSLSTTRARTAQGVALLVIAAVIFFVGGDLRVWNVRADAASWSDAVASGAVECEKNPSGDLALPVKPDFLGAMVVPCSVVVSGTDAGS